LAEKLVDSRLAPEKVPESSIRNLAQASVKASAEKTKAVIEAVDAQDAKSSLLATQRPKREAITLASIDIQFRYA
jgi:hypothetical protein